MIICVSANPAIDKRLVVDAIVVGEVNRVHSAIAFAGGKAAHVAMAAKALGEDVTWIGLLGGETGDEIERQLAEFGINVVSVRTKAVTRTNLEIIDDGGRITEILEPGGTVEASELHELRLACTEAFEEAEDGTVVVLSGSLPPGMPTEEFGSLTAAARNCGATVIVDTSVEALTAAIESCPDLIKPNKSEAEKAASVRISGEGNALKVMKTLMDHGARAVCLTLGADGLAYWDGQAEPVFVTPPKVDVTSTVGCGDATVAGLAVAMKRRLDLAATARLAAACGAANCLAHLPGQIKKNTVDDLIGEVLVRSGS